MAHDLTYLLVALGSCIALGLAVLITILTVGWVWPPIGLVLGMLGKGLDKYMFGPVARWVGTHAVRPMVRWGRLLASLCLIALTATVLPLWTTPFSLIICFVVTVAVFRRWSLDESERLAGVPVPYRTVPIDEDLNHEILTTVVFMLAISITVTLRLMDAGAFDRTASFALSTVRVISFVAQRGVNALPVIGNLDTLQIEVPNQARPLQPWGPLAAFLIKTLFDLIVLAAIIKVVGLSSAIIQRDQVKRVRPKLATGDPKQPIDALGNLARKGSLEAVAQLEEIAIFGERFRPDFAILSATAADTLCILNKTVRHVSIYSVDVAIQGYRAAILDAEFNKQHVLVRHFKFRLSNALHTIVGAYGGYAGQNALAEASALTVELIEGDKHAIEAGSSPLILFSGNVLADFNYNLDRSPSSLLPYLAELREKLDTAAPLAEKRHHLVTLIANAAICIAAGGLVDQIPDRNGLNDVIESALADAEGEWRGCLLVAWSHWRFAAARELQADERYAARLKIVERLDHEAGKCDEGSPIQGVLHFGLAASLCALAAFQPRDARLIERALTSLAIAQRHAAMQVGAETLVQIRIMQAICAAQLARMKGSDMSPTRYDQALEYARLAHLNARDRVPPFLTGLAGGVFGALCCVREGVRDPVSPDILREALELIEASREQLSRVPEYLVFVSGAAVSGILNLAKLGVASVEEISRGASDARVAISVAQSGGNPTAEGSAWLALTALLEKWLDLSRGDARLDLARQGLETADACANFGPYLEPISFASSFYKAGNFIYAIHERTQDADLLIEMVRRLDRFLQLSAQSPWEDTYEVANARFHLATNVSSLSDLGLLDDVALCERAISEANRAVSAVQRLDDDAMAQLMFATGCFHTFLESHGHDELDSIKRSLDAYERGIEKYPKAGPGPRAFLRVNACSVALRLHAATGDRKPLEVAYARMDEAFVALEEYGMKDISPAELCRDQAHAALHGDEETNASDRADD